MLEGSALAWFNWRMRGGLIDGWEDFVKKFQIRFAPLHDLDYICFEKTSEKSRDTFAHMVENTNTLPAPTMEDTNKLKESNEKSFINVDNDSGSVIVGNDGGIFDEDYGANIQSDEPPNKSYSTSRELSVPLNASVGMTIAEYEVLAGVEKVADTDNKQVYNLNSFDDTIKLFDIVDVVATEHLVSATTYSTCRVSYGHHFASRARILEDSKHGLRLWFSFISPVQKHEWEPPP
ncbi:unnamed protein product [Cuscuta campestris]|uniref:Retrotransposon gag domain-containing protein n=1 Tax=Cuscuta campestris TaxID=132261 RepID=A0A484MYG6_9ASTE|nr:unnamed protein product [Cuscuta campestris]